MKSSANYSQRRNLERKKKESRGNALWVACICMEIIPRTAEHALTTVQCICWNHEWPFPTMGAQSTCKSLPWESQKILQPSEERQQLGRKWWWTSYAICEMTHESDLNGPFALSRLHPLQSSVYQLSTLPILSSERKMKIIQDQSEIRDMAMQAVELNWSLNKYHAQRDLLWHSKQDSHRTHWKLWELPSQLQTVVSQYIV